MPIYEFKCSKCEHFFEMIVMGDSDKAELSCPECGSEIFERVLSATGYSMAPGSGSGASGESRTGSTAVNRTCSSGSCTTYNIAGHSRD
ncbi:MAG: zinc ribbon domain-containing protein [Desulfobacterales bacterium]|nr:zinc ribbon domain-containing protein [Desulfobacterales bacterium]